MLNSYMTCNMFLMWYHVDCHNDCTKLGDSIPDEHIMSYYYATSFYVTGIWQFTHCLSLYNQYMQTISWFFTQKCQFYSKLKI